MLCWKWCHQWNSWINSHHIWTIVVCCMHGALYTMSTIASSSRREYILPFCIFKYSCKPAKVCCTCCIRAYYIFFLKGNLCLCKWILILKVCWFTRVICSKWHKCWSMCVIRWNESTNIWCVRFWTWTHVSRKPRIYILTQCFFCYHFCCMRKC